MVDVININFMGLSKTTNCLILASSRRCLFSLFGINKGFLIQFSEEIVINMQLWKQADSKTQTYCIFSYIHTSSEELNTRPMFGS